MNMYFLCELCGAGFCQKRYLSQHKLRVHNLKVTKEFTCNVCGKQYRTKKSLTNHASIHNPTKKSIECQEENCTQKFHILRKLRCHLRTDHGILNIDVCQNLEFVKYEDFKEWLAEEEKKTNSRYIITAKTYGSECKYITFACNRGGVYKPTTHDRQRKLKAEGTIKLGFHCTSSIYVKELCSKVMVSYYKGHYKHANVLSRVPIPRKKIRGNFQGVQKRIINVEEISDENYSDTYESIKRLIDSLQLVSFSNLDENVAIQVKHHFDMIKIHINAIRRLLSITEVPNKKIKLSRPSSLQTNQKAE